MQLGICNCTKPQMFFFHQTRSYSNKLYQIHRPALSIVHGKASAAQSTHTSEFYTQAHLWPNFYFELTERVQSTLVPWGKAHVKV